MSKSKISISAEFFPPKTEEGARQILRAANAIKNYNLDFVSITYGAGGSSRERTLEYGELLREIFNFDVMPHLTCVGHSVDEIRNILEGFHRKNFKRVMALRGDAPKDVSTTSAYEGELKYSSDLIALISKEFPEIEIACAGYPEKHPEAKSLEDDIAALKKKVDSGANTVLTQLFFDNTSYFDFVKKCHAAGINKPIEAGIMPALSLKQVRNFCTMCGSVLPKALEEKLAAAPDEDAQREVGLDWAKAQICELIEKNVDGLHLYILNRPHSAIELMEYISARI